MQRNFDVSSLVKAIHPGLWRAANHLLYVCSCVCSSHWPTCAGDYIQESNVGLVIVYTSKILVAYNHGGTIPAVTSSLPLFGINFAFIVNTTLKHFHITFESRTLKLNGALRLNVVKFVYWVVCYSTDTGGNIKVVLLPPWLIVAKHRITNLLATHRHVTLLCVTRCDQQCWKI